MNILVLYGGDSPEREVSLSSGVTIAEALKTSGHTVFLLDTINGFDEIKEYKDKVDIVFPILHGQKGEDGIVQKVLEDLGIKFLGAGSKVSENTFDKIKTHEILSKFNILMPSFEKVNKSSFSTSDLSKKPYVLKPIDGGSSLDTQIVRVVTDFELQRSSVLLEKYPEMLLEQLIDGKEITVPVFGNRCLDVIAIIPPENEEFNYENKYNDKSQEICPAPESYISKELQLKSQEIALSVHDNMGVRHLSRTDLILSSDNELYVLEINTMPGMRPQSLYPKAAARAGMDMPTLVDEFIKLVEDK